jgi:4'-phosphopantetheinyl transferase
MPSKTEPQIVGPWDATRIDSLPALELGMVHLWQRRLHASPAEVTSCYELLSDQEKERALRFRVERPRTDFILTRGTLRLLLARYLNTAPRSLQFRYEAHGKPVLESNDLCFNVSHCNGLAILAFVQQRAIGVDVENLSRDTDVRGLAERFFSDFERQALRYLSGPELHAAFFRCWTRKEAYIKATGDGLALPLDQFDVSIAEGDRDALLATRPDASEAARWTIFDVPVGPAYAAAVAVAEE